ncbi:MAG: hydroxymethylbilane synthase [Deltaproteobacteria bacterium]|nr:hydroxymethylbilane synthase [Deltaproteobacteria bacterium]
MILKIGTRGSKLALTQSEWIKGKIEARHPEVRVELVRIKTKGDKILDSPLSLIGGKGLFVKEIEDALLRGDVDLAVHSMKDVPSELPEGLVLGVFPEREDPRDAFVSVRYESLHNLPDGSRVGTSSLRRGAQLLHLHPGLELVSVRGNVDTRLRKLESGEFEAIVLASAGLKRLGLEKRITRLFPTHQMLPAIAQGALGLEMRSDHDDVLQVLSFLNHGPTEVTVRAERAFLKELQGGCQVPIAGHARLEGDDLILQGMVAELDGSRLITDDISGHKDRAEDMGVELARRLLHEGADRILAGVYGEV